MCVYMHVHVCAPREADWRLEGGAAASREEPDEPPGLAAEETSKAQVRARILPL